jgi:AcrR family transcriptional regulator
MNVVAPTPPRRQATQSDTVAPPNSVLKILEGALSAIMRHGPRRLSMSDISDLSGVSRGTLYRYFPTKQDVLAAVSDSISVAFETGVREAAARHADPLERMRAVLGFFEEATWTRRNDAIFEIEPAFHLDFFRSHFDRHIAALRDALDLTFDWLEARIGCAVDRDVTTEMLVRLQLSTMIVPPGQHWIETMTGLPDHLENLLMLAARPLATAP